MVDDPGERELAAPHRFAKLLGATFTAVTRGFLLVGSAAGAEIVATLGFVVVATVAVLATIGAGLNICVGCRMYEQVAFFRWLG